jgi:hypothetical protein
MVPVVAILKFVPADLAVDASDELGYPIHMKMTILLLIIVALPLQAIAGEPRAPKQRQPVTAIKPKPPAGNPCAEYGAGFVRVEGSTTCIRVGGGIGVGAGIGR